MAMFGKSRHVSRISAATGLFAILLLWQPHAAKAALMSVDFAVLVTSLENSNDDGRLAGIRIGDELKGSLSFGPDCARVASPTWCSTDTTGGFESLGNLVPKKAIHPFELDIWNDHPFSDAIKDGLNFHSVPFFSDEDWQILGFTTQLSAIACAFWSCVPDMSRWPGGEPLEFRYSASTDDGRAIGLRGVVTYLLPSPIPMTALLFATALGVLGIAVRRRHRRPINRTRLATQRAT